MCCNDKEFMLNWRNIYKIYMLILIVNFIFSLKYKFVVEIIFVILTRWLLLLFKFALLGDDYNV